MIDPAAPQRATAAPGSEVRSDLHARGGGEAQHGVDKIVVMTGEQGGCMGARYAGGRAAMRAGSRHPWHGPDAALGAGVGKAT